MSPYTSIFCAAVALSFCARGEDPLPDVARLQTSPVLRQLKKNPFPGEPKTAAEKTVAQMYVPEGFRVDLVLSEPDLQQPIAFTFDERGRLWVAEAYSYPTKRAAGQGEDKIVIFEDKDGDGKFETRKVFAEKLNLVSGLEVGYGGVWVGAAPELLFIPDKNHDDIPDGPAQILLDGFGFQDTHETLNSFIWGPDGWLYGNQGVFNLAHIGKPRAPDSEPTELRAGVWRYHPVRHDFEVFAHGGSNQL
jgi:putative membrane-bound dehydrogenase-like protein